MPPQLPCKAVWAAYKMGRESGYCLTFCPDYGMMRVPRNKLDTLNLTLRADAPPFAESGLFLGRTNRRQAAGRLRSRRRDNART